MSYVLDALRRAEAERQRGHVPGLHAQTLPAPDAAASEPGQSPRRAGPWAPAALLVAAVVAAVLWWAAGRGAPDVADAVQAPAVAVAPPPVVVLAPPASPVRPAPARVAAVPAPAPAEPAPAAAEVPDRIVKLEQLPDTLRRQIPPLAFGGATHSPEPSARMLIINGQIWREGEQPAPGLTLERIELRGAQFRFRDRRFEVAY